MATSVHVIHIPANGSSISPAELLTVQQDHKECHGNLTEETKKRLQQVPDLAYYIGQGLFSWDYRGLFELVVPKDRVPKGSQGWEGCYIMYKCNSVECGLPFNRNFVGIVNARVFGDAFLFKLNEPECDQSGKATFQILGSEFVQSVKDGGFAIEILGTLSKV